MRVVFNRNQSISLVIDSKRKRKVVGKVLYYKPNKITKVKILRPKNITDTELNNDNSMIVEAKNKKEIKLKISYYLFGEYEKNY